MKLNSQDRKDRYSLNLNGAEVARYISKDNTYYIVNYINGNEFMKEVGREAFVDYVKSLAFVYIMNESISDDYRGFCKHCDI